VNETIESLAMETTERIIADLNDRRGLKSEWRQIAPEIQDQIRYLWAELIASAIREEAKRIAAPFEEADRDDPNEWFPPGVVAERIWRIAGLE